MKLPTKRKAANFDLNEYLILVYGREKIGKTVLFAQWPDALFLTTEPGTKGMEIFEIECKSWTSIREAVKLLEKEPERFRTVIIDTVDRAYDMCLDWVCEQRGIEYPGEDDQGRNDYGKSWKAVKQEFLSVIHRVAFTGRGICLTSHAREQEIKTRSGDKYTRIFPSMSGQARAVVEAIVDIFFYADYMKGADGGTVRTLLTKGDETIWAGHRKMPAAVPMFIPLLEEDGYDVFKGCLMGELEGIDPATLRVSRATSDTMKNLVNKEKAKAVRKGVQKPSKPAVLPKRKAKVKRR